MFTKRDIKSAPTGVKLVLAKMLALFVGVGLPQANFYKARCKIGTYRLEIGIGKMLVLLVGVGLSHANKNAALELRFV